MSRYFNQRFSTLIPYVPGEQPQDIQYIKLNTNESPFPPSPGVLKAVSSEVDKLQLYSDPTCRQLAEKLAELYGVKPSQVILTNGSDEALYFAFLAFADKDKPLVFPEITYGFYSVFADLCGIPYKTVCLQDDYTILPSDFIPQDGARQTVVIANPNAPTGLCLTLSEIESILQANQENLVIVDEAYIDFGGESAVSLIERYDNLLVTQTFSKSRSMAGARLGFAIGNEALISDMHTIRYSTNPYNVNRMTLSAGYAALVENEYYMSNCKEIVRVRDNTKKSLENRGFDVLSSSTNFLFARSNEICGEELYSKLKEKGILVRHFNKERIKDFIRVTIGTEEQMNCFLSAIDSILGKEGN